MIYEKNTQSSPTQLYDLTMVDKMCRGNQESILKMVHVFIRQIVQSVEELTKAYEIQDFEKIKKEIHKVKPTLAYYGTPQIEKELQQLEKLVAGTFTEREIEKNISTLNTITMQTITKMKTDFSISNN